MRRYRAPPGKVLIGTLTRPFATLWQRNPFDGPTDGRPCSSGVGATCLLCSSETLSHPRGAVTRRLSYLSEPPGTGVDLALPRLEAPGRLIVLPMPYRPRHKKTPAL